MTRVARRPLILLLAFSIACTPACAGGLGGLLKSPAAATVTLNPTEQQVQDARRLGIRLADSVTFSIEGVEEAVKFADGLERAGALAPSTLATMATFGKRYNTLARAGLQEIRTSLSNPSLLATVKRLNEELDLFLQELEASKNPALVNSARMIRLGTKVMGSFLSGGIR